MTEAQAAPTAAKAGFLDWLAVGGGMVGCFMAILDIQVTNASLAQIEGAIGASIDEGSWISTAYLIAEIIVIPLTGWLSTIFGLKRYLVVNTVLFVVFSLGCALSTSLFGLIACRVAQGLTGGALIPTGLSIIRLRLPPRQQPVGIALFGVGGTAGPAMGPLVGGWLTDNFSWHFIFYLNIGPGLIAIALLLWALDAEPLRLSGLRRGDWWGIASMAIGLGATTIVLEEGQRREWFGSPMIRETAIIAAIALIFFLIIEFTSDRPFINLRLLGRRTVSTSNLLSGVVGAAAYGASFLIPVYLALVPHYGARQIGIVVMMAGVPQLLVFPFLPFLLRTAPPRLVVTTGALILAASSFLNGGLTHDSGTGEFMLPQILRAVGFPLFAVPLLQLSMAGLSPRDVADASSLTNVFRNLGASIGIALLSALALGRERLHFAAISDRITANAILANDRMDQLTGFFTGSSGDAATARMQALGMLYGQTQREAMVLAYSDAFTALGVLLLLSIPMVFLLPNAPLTDPMAAGH